MSSPKTDFLASHIVSGYTTVVGTEDTQFWSKRVGVTALNDPSMISGESQEGVVMLAEVLQKVDDPLGLVNKARAKAPRLVITVPNEFGWDAKFKPMQNPQHKRTYDTDDLAELLEQANLKYKLGLIEYQGWAFWTAECTT